VSNTNINHRGSAAVGSRRFAIGRRAALLGGLAACLSRPSSAMTAETRYFRVASGPIQSRSFRIGTAIAGTVSAPVGLRGCDRDRVCGVPGLIGLAISTNGPVENLRLVANRGAEAGLCQGGLIAMAHAKSGAAGSLAGSEAISVLAPLYQEFVHLVVLADSPIKEVADLRATRLAWRRIGWRPVCRAAGPRGRAPVGTPSEDLEPDTWRRRRSARRAGDRRIFLR